MDDRNLKIGIAGLRGIVGDSLTPEIVKRITAAFLKVSKRKKIVVGRDTRESGVSIQNTILATLKHFHCNSIDLGIATTPTVEIMVPELKADGGIIITASHNPPEWNGIKFLNEQGLFIDEAEWEKISNTFEQEDFELDPNIIIKADIGIDNSVDRHLNRVLSVDYLPIELIKSKRFRVAYDGNGGTGGTIFPIFFKELGCETILAGCDRLGEFSHGLEPTATNLEGVGAAWRDKNIDIGFASDPDSDRLVVIAENGKVLSEEYTLALSTEFVVSKKSGTVVINLSTSSVIESIAQRYNVDVFRTKIGERNVVEGMLEHGAVIGGEGNGGVILPDVHLGRDGIVGAVLILALLADRDMNLSRIIQTLPLYFMEKEKILDNGKLDSDLNNFVCKFSPEKVDYTDGVRLVFPNGWLHLRKSNTEPIIRIIAESDSKKGTANLIKMAKEYLL